MRNVTPLFKKSGVLSWAFFFWLAGWEVKQKGVITLHADCATCGKRGPRNPESPACSIPAVYCVKEKPVLLNFMN